MPRVSVIIPTYNCAAYLPEAIGSVLNQTQRDLEIIVVDDGSTDATRDVLRPFMTRNAISYLYQQNQGPGAARNAGIAASRGDYIAFLDADDSLTPASVERRMNLLANCPELSFAFSDYYYRPTRLHVQTILGDQFLARYRQLARSAPQGIIFDGDSVIKEFEVPFNVFTGTVLLRKSVLDNAGLFRTDIWIGEDRDMWLRIARRYTFGYIPAPLAYYNHYRSTLTGKDPVKALRSRMEFIQSLLNEHTGRKDVVKVLRKRMGCLHFELGAQYLGTAKIASMQCFLKSLYYNPSDVRTYRWLSKTLLPGKCLNLARNFRKRKSGPGRPRGENEALNQSG